MKIFALAPPIGFGLLLWQLDSLLSWLIVGLILGGIVGWHNARGYDPGREKAKPVLDDHMHPEASLTFGKKTDSIGATVIFGLILGVFLYGIDRLIGWVF